MSSGSLPVVRCALFPAQMSCFWGFYLDCRLYISATDIVSLQHKMTDPVCGIVQTSPNLESPKYVVWKKTKEYEIRRYSPYLAAEVSMPSDAKPASGEGFNELAGYIFGGNQRYLLNRTTVWLESWPSEVVSFIPTSCDTCFVTCSLLEHASHSKVVVI